MKKILVMLCLFVLAFVGCASAMPTPTVSALAWDQYSDSNAVGFYIYWRDQNAAGSAYNDLSKFKLTGTTLITEPFSTFLPIAHPAKLCIVMTAFDAGNNESQFSNEVCGFTGFSTLQHLKAQ